MVANQVPYRKTESPRAVVSLKREFRTPTICWAFPTKVAGFPVSGFSPTGFRGSTHHREADLVEESWASWFFLREKFGSRSILPKIVGGLVFYPEKRGKLSAADGRPPEALWSVANHPLEWMRRVQGTESRYYRAIGSAEALMLKAADLGQRWMKGISGEFALKKSRKQPIPW